MSTLHVLSHSPFTDSRLTSCLLLLSKQDGILLTGDAVYALQATSDPWQRLQSLSADNRLHALVEDLDARGLTCPPDVQTVDYRGFVDLCLHYQRVNTWL